MQPGVRWGSLQQKRGPQPVCAPGTEELSAFAPGGSEVGGGGGGGLLATTALSPPVFT